MASGAGLSVTRIAEVEQVNGAGLVGVGTCGGEVDETRHSTLGADDVSGKVDEE